MFPKLLPLGYVLFFALLPQVAGAEEKPAPPAKEAAAERAPLPPQYMSILQDAVRRFHARDWDATLAKLDEAEKLAPPTAMTLNVRAAIAIERRQFEQGAATLQQALKLDPKFFPARFNVAEIPFLQKNYAEARRIYEELLIDDATNELLLYRIFLTHLAEGNDEAAKTALTRIKFPSDTGSYYYAQAAWDFAHGNEEGAQKWIKISAYVFPPEKNLYYADALVELGWLKREAAPAGKP